MLLPYNAYALIVDLPMSMDRNKCLWLQRV